MSGVGYNWKKRLNIEKEKKNQEKIDNGKYQKS